jgi:hypothetical protein
VSLGVWLLGVLLLGLVVLLLLLLLLGPVLLVLLRAWLQVPGVQQAVAADPKPAAAA